MDRSPFATLPPELRNTIYELDLSSPDRFELEVDGRVHASDNVIRKYLAITETCRVMRSESLALFYASNVFFIRTSRKSRKNSVPLVRRWTRGLQGQAQHLRRMGLFISEVGIRLKIRSSQGISASLSTSFRLPFRSSLRWSSASIADFML